MPEQTMSDHDLTTTLVADVRNLKDGTDKFHIEMKESQERLRNEMRDLFLDLKSGTTDRLKSLEACKADATTVIALEKRIDEDFEKRIKFCEDELPKKATKDFVDTINIKVLWAYAFSAGVSAVAGVVVSLIVIYFKGK